MVEGKSGKKNGRKLGREVRERTLTYIVAAFSLVASLAWNETVKSMIDYFFPAGTNIILIKLLYAVGITLVVVLITIYLERLFREKNEER